MKFGRLTEYNMRDIILEKSYIKCGEETSPRLFSRKLKFKHINRLIVWSFIQSVYIVFQIEGYQNILKLSFRLLAFTSY